LLVFAGMMSCGGSNNSTPPPPPPPPVGGGGTPAGTFVLTVTGTAGIQSHTTSISLTVH
jgi:hypothetical protein